MKAARTVARAQTPASGLRSSPKHLRPIPSLSSSAAPTSSLSTSHANTSRSRLLSQHNLSRTANSAASVALISRRSYATSDPTTLSTSELKKTGLYDLHLAHGAKMVPFGGFHMPVQYSSLGVAASHAFTREKASLFDVGHMVQHIFSGPGAKGFLQRVTPASLAEGKLPVHQSTLSTLLWGSEAKDNEGGIVDDCIVTKLAEDKFYVVTNAACRDKDLGYLASELEKWKGDGKGEVKHEVLDGQGLIALQGPLSEEILSEILVAPEEARLKELYFGQSRYIMVKLSGTGLSSPLLVSRGGYTGEDGFEISIPEEETVAVTEALLESAGKERLQFAGLGARDSLRLEAGMCLYGHDLDDTTTPVEAALSWVIGKDRRDPHAEDKFHGSDKILKQVTPKSKGGAGVARRRIGLVVEGAPAREGAEIVDGEGQKVGVVTSGCPSPTLGKNIAMAYIKDGLHKSGTEVEIIIRGRKRKATVTKMPFVPSKYWKGTAPA